MPRLPSKEDVYGGVVIDMGGEGSAELANDADAFDSALGDDLAEWRKQGKRGIWLRLPQNAFGLLARAVDGHAFEVHHCQPGSVTKDGNAYIMLTLWLPVGVPNLLPGYATHNIGCAGLVVDGDGDEQKFLAIRERWGSYKGLKLPGGSADMGEQLSEVAKREVFEETGVRATPVGVLCFRHMVEFKFGISDIYFVFVMRADTTEIVMDEHEISECSWRNVKQSLADEELLEENGMLRGILERYQSWSETHDFRLGWDDLRLGSTLRKNQQMYDIVPKL